LLIGIGVFVGVFVGVLLVGVGIVFVPICVGLVADFSGRILIGLMRLGCVGSRLGCVSLRLRFPPRHVVPVLGYSAQILRFD
jgi:hypothetical protein